MGTLKRRVNLTIGCELFEKLDSIKKIRNETSLSKVVLDLVNDALEINEDLYFSRVAEDRKLEKLIRHSDVWLKWT